MATAECRGPATHAIGENAAQVVSIGKSGLRCDVVDAAFGEHQQSSGGPNTAAGDVSGGRGAGVLLEPANEAQFAIPAQAGSAYVVEPVSLPNTSLRQAQVAGAANAAPRSLGPVVIGVR